MSAAVTAVDGRHGDAVSSADSHDQKNPRSWLGYIWDSWDKSPEVSKAVLEDGLCKLKIAKQ